MIRNSDIARKLSALCQKSSESERAYRAALAHIRDGNDAMVFIDAWQEHAQMLSELEEKIRFLQGVSDEHPLGPVWNGFLFKEDPSDPQMIEALAECERCDSELLMDYEYLLKTALPVDIRMMLKLHDIKIRGFRGRITKKIELLTHAAHAEGRADPANLIQAASTS